jgi:hypothetical protein
MISFLSLVTSVKDYVEIIHKLIESDTAYTITDYSELGAIITYILLTLNQFVMNFVSLNWLKSIWDLPIIVPEISSAMISEISVLDGFFHNAFNFLDRPVSYGDTNLAIYSLEKFTIGLINSLFLFIPTSTAHLITLRRFVIQGLEAGYLAGLGSIAGSVLWITSVIFGFRFFVIPWVSLDIFRYLLGFVLLVKYMWDSYNEKKLNLTNPAAKQKIFLLNFLLALTEQTSIYPFISNLSIGSESSILESFPAKNYVEFISIHGCYIFGLLIGCISLLNFTCWFWENPAFKIYMWIIASPKFKMSSNFYYKVLNFVFLYLTMICAISSIPYYGLDYTITNPLGFVQDDRILDQKLILETSFLNTKASDRNTRRNRGRHGRRERWKRKIRKYRTFDASLYDQGIYDLFTVEDLNYGFDRFWLRRKMRNHRVRFRFFPGGWMRSFKKQLAKPRLESYAGPRQDFFRILFEQVYHPSFHEYKSIDQLKKKETSIMGEGNLPKLNKNQINKIASLSGSNFPRDLATNSASNLVLKKNIISLFPKKDKSNFGLQPNLEQSMGMESKPILNGLRTPLRGKSNFQIENATLRKFVRKINKRIKNSEIKNNFNSLTKLGNDKNSNKKFIYSKRWKQIFSNVSHEKNNSDSTNGQLKGLLRNFYNTALTNNDKDFNQQSLNKILFKDNTIDSLGKPNLLQSFSTPFVGLRSLFEEGKKGQDSTSDIKKENSKLKLSKHEEQILKYRSIFGKSPSFLEANSDLTPSSLSERSAVGVSLKKGRSTQPEGANFQTKNQLNNENSANLLHPLKYYLKKQNGFERKLRYYTPTIFRKFSIENNAPYFRIMMKRYFYYYKPTLRWKRTLKVASLRKARRKTSSTPKKLQLNEMSLGTNLEVPAKQALPSESLRRRGGDKNGEKQNSGDSEISSSFSNLGNQNAQKDSFPIKRRINATHNYTIIGKRATRYRYQIYKDVLQHWYYSPFNRLLLKFDVDLFINRQPNSHFLSKNEENLLHLRRFLLSEHYNTLRWYSYMQHYRSMKTKIGGTKSFASGIYNQQFAGTFKKIRHLFAITPSQGAAKPLSSKGLPPRLDTLVLESQQPILKFDQNLYNDYLNSSTNNYQKNLIIHEELIGGETNPKLNNLLNQSTQVIREYLMNTNLIKQNYIKQLIQEKNYIELTNFLYKGQKTRGLKPITNQKSLGLQEKEYLFTKIEKNEFGQSPNLEKIKLEKFLRPLQQDLWVNLLKKWKKKINDQEFLKNYLQRRIDKREKRKQKKEKTLKVKLNRLEDKETNLLLAFGKGVGRNDLEVPANTPPSLSERSAVGVSLKKGRKALPSESLRRRGGDKNVIPFFVPTANFPPSTGVEKALIEGVYTLKDENNKFLKISERENFKENLNWNKLDSESLRSKQNTFQNLENQKINQINFTIKKPSINSLNNLSILKKEKELIYSLNHISKLNIFSSSSSPSFLQDKNEGASYTGIVKTNKSDSVKLKQKKMILASFQPINFKIISMKIKNLYSKYKFRYKKFISTKLTNLFKSSQKNGNKKERSLNKEKRSRKEFRLFSKKPFKTNLTNYLDEKTDLRLNLNRKKRDYSEIKLEETQISNKEQTNSFVGNLFGKALFNKKEQEQRTSGASLLLRDSDGKHLGSETRSETGRNWKSVSTLLKRTYLKYFTKKFKRKKSPQRRARIRRNRGVTKKRTLSDSLKREFKNLRKYGEKIDNKKQKIYLSFNSALNKEINADGIFTQNPLQRRAKQKKQRFWKQKRSKYSQKLRKYKKRRRSILGKVRILNKQLKKIKATTELKNWWWKNFLPNLRATTDSLWQYEKDRQIQQKLSELTIPEIIERDKLTNLSNGAKISDLLQIGNFDYKPLALPEAIKLMTSSPSGRFVPTTKKGSIQPFEEKAGQLPKNNVPFLIPTEQDVISRVAETILLSETSFPFGAKIKNSDNQILPTSTLPFYAGWDESLRKFVVTNRLLSRRESGYEIPINNNSSEETSKKLVQNSVSNISESNSIQNEMKNNLVFTSAPLKGMNAATTLYWQIPFTTYDPDQFFALGMDGFAPLGWRRFQFRHSILKSWLYEKTTSGELPNELKKTSPSFLQKEKGGISQTPNNKIIIKNKTNIINQNILNDQFIYKIKEKINQNLSTNISSNSSKAATDLLNFSKISTLDTKNTYRRLKKRYRRVKKHPRSPAWFPSGPLLNQVLPVHYIYIFYKRSRLPRDRYIKRRLRKVKTSGELPTELRQIPDFTLRKRIKTKRKYHIKQDLTKKAPLIPRRMKFIGDDITAIRWRPLSRQKLNKSIAELIKEQRALKYKQRKKDENATNTKQSSNIRIKQLRRRVQRQIIRSVWRYRPRAGGFVWPGDYLKLELVKAPKLHLEGPCSAAPTSSSESFKTKQKETKNQDDGLTKIKRKKKRNIPESHIQPKKYLLEKHNSNVIKKKLEKAQRSNKVKERIKELNLII